MKHNWEYKRLGDVCKIVNGFAFKSELFKDSGMPILRIANIQNDTITTDALVFCNPSDYKTDLSKFLVKSDDLVMALSGATTGKIGINKTNIEFYLNQRVALFKDIIISRRYLFYFLKTEGKNILESAFGVAQPNVSTSKLTELYIPVPTQNVQERIVAELDKINDVIEDCRELLRNLDALAQSLFYDFFGDPITNPKGWPIDKLGNLLIIERGGSPRPIKEYITQDEDGINWIKIGDANSSMYISSTKEKIKPSGKSKSRFVKPGDFILSNSMSFGRPYIMNTYGCIHDGWLLLRDNNNFFNKIYLYYCLNSKSIYSEFERLVRTGTVSNLNSDIVRGVKIPVPPLAHQEKFAERIEQIEAQKKAVEQTIAELQTLLDSRMDYWFN